MNLTECMVDVVVVVVDVDVVVVVVVFLQSTSTWPGRSSRKSSQNNGRLRGASLLEQRKATSHFRAFCVSYALH